MKSTEFKLHDVVTNINPYPDEDIPANSEGVIVYIYDIPVYTEVEFIVNNISIVRTCHINNLTHHESTVSGLPSVV